MDRLSNKNKGESVFFFDAGEREIVVMACMGHDLIEDARVTYNDIITMLSDTPGKGSRVADIIYCCTEDKGRNRAERHSQRFYDQLYANKLATFVKLCDIIANIKYSLLTNSTMFNKYKKEHSKVVDYLYTDDYMDMLIYMDNLFKLN